MTCSCAGPGSAPGAVSPVSDPIAPHTGFAKCRSRAPNPVPSRGALWYRLPPLEPGGAARLHGSPSSPARSHVWTAPPLLTPGSQATQEFPPCWQLLYLPVAVWSQGTHRNRPRALWRAGLLSSAPHWSCFMRSMTLASASVSPTRPYPRARGSGPRRKQRTSTTIVSFHADTVPSRHLFHSQSRCSATVDLSITPLVNRSCGVQDAKKNQLFVDDFEENDIGKSAQPQVATSRRCQCKPVGIYNHLVDANSNGLNKGIAQPL